jgi:uncharacterized protein (TIGR00369 family)
MNPLFQEMIDGRRPLPRCMETLRGRILEAAEGYFRIEYTAGEEQYNPVNVVQGGFLAAMLDDTLGPAIATTLAADEFHSTLDLHVQFLRAATAGTLIGEGRVTSRSRSVATAEGTLKTTDGKEVARAIATSMIRKMSPEQQSELGVA